MDDIVKLVSEKTGIPEDVARQAVGVVLGELKKKPVEKLLQERNRALSRHSECIGCMTCEQACPTRAITFGDLDNPNHRVAKLIQDPRAFRLLEELGTKPKVYYLAEEH